MAGRTYRIQYQLDGDAKGAVRAAKVTEAELRKLQKGQSDAAEGSKRLRGNLQGVDNQLAGVARAATAAALGLASAFSARQIIRNTIEQEEAVAQLNATLRSTGNDGGAASQQIQQMASELQSLTTFGDEATLKSAGLLLTFRQIGGETFPRAQKAILDVATAMGTDLNSATLQVGKALNDPVAGLSALSRSGIQFTAEQKNLIKGLVETGDAAAAQAVILTELEAQFGGSAEAAANTFGGAIQQLKNTFGDLLEGGGGSLNDATAAVQSLKETLEDPAVVAAFAAITDATLGTAAGLAEFLATTVEFAQAFGVQSAYLVEQGRINFGALKNGIATNLNDLRAVVVELLGEVLNKVAGTLAQIGAAADNIPFAGAIADQLNRAAGSITAFTADAAAAASARAAALSQEREALTAAAEANRRVRDESIDALVAQRQKSDEAGTAAIDLAAAVTGAGTAIETMAGNAGQGAADLDVLRGQLEQLVSQGLTPTERALETFEGQMATLQDGLAAGLIDPAEFADVADRLKTQYWDKITGDGRKAGEDVGKTVADLQAELDGLSFGSQFAQGFDDASRAAGEFLDGINGLIEAQSKFTALREEHGASESALAAIASAQARAQVGLFGDMTQAAKGFFDEGQDGYKALTAAEQTFRVIELAMAAENLAVKLGLIQTETIAVQGAAAAKAAAEGVAAAVSSMVGLPFPANIAALGATIAAITALGVQLTGGGGGGDFSGALDTGGASGIRTSGTILGDPEAASESITNALDRATEIADADLTQSRLMVQSLQNIEAALAGVTSEFASFAAERGVQQFTLGGTAGDVSVQAASRVRFDWREYVRGEVEGEIERLQQAASRAQDALRLSVSGIFASMSQVIGEAATAFGADSDAAIAAFNAIEFNNIEFRETDDISEALAQFFSAVGDSAVEELQAMIGINVAALQQAGEGMLDTLTRVYAEVNVARSGLDRIDSGLGDLDPQRLAAISSALITAAGGLTEFIDLTKGFVDAFRTESQQLDIAQREATQAIGQLGFALPGTREEFAALVDSVTVTDAASAQLKVGLLELVPALDELYGLTEDIAADALDVRRAFGLAASEFDDTLSSLGLAADTLPETNEGMRQFIDGLTEADQAALRPFIGDLQNLITATEDAAEATARAAASQEQMVRSAERADELAGRRGRLAALADVAEANRQSNIEAEQAARDSQAAALAIGDSATAYAEAFNIALGEIRNSGFIGTKNSLLQAVKQQQTQELLNVRRGLVQNAISTPTDLSDMSAFFEIFVELARLGDEARGSPMLFSFFKDGGIAQLTGDLDLFFADLSRAAENLASVSGNVTAAVDSSSTALQRLTNIIASVDAATATGNTSGVADLIADAAMRAQEVIAGRADEVLQAAVAASVGINDVAALDAALVQMFDLLAKGRIDAEQFESAFDLAVGQFQGLTDAVEAVADAVRSADDILRERLGLERQLLELQGDTAALRALDRAAIDESNHALFDQINALRDAKDAEQALTQARTDAASALRQAFDRESAVLQGRIDQFGGISTALGDLARNLRGEIAADGGLDIARSRFEDIARRAQVGDLAALEQFAGAGNDYAGLLRDSTLSQEQYVRELAAITRATDAAQGVADRQGSIAEQQLDALTSQVSALIEINDSVLTVAQAIDNLNAVGLVPQSAQSSVTAPQSLTVTPFVQPTGTAPSGSTDNASLIAEVRLLRQELQAIKSNTGSTASNTDQINVTLRRVTQEGDGVTVYSGEEVSVLAA